MTIEVEIVDLKTSMEVLETELTKLTESVDELGEVLRLILFEIKLKGSAL